MQIDAKLRISEIFIAARVECFLLHYDMQAFALVTVYPDMIQIYFTRFNKFNVYEKV